MKGIASLIAALPLIAINQAPAETLAIVGGVIIDGNGGKPISDGVILIENERITAIGGRSITVPQQAKTIDAAGKYVIPGLMDASAYLVLDVFPYTLTRYEGRYDELAIEAAQVALKNGVTTVFDGWGPREYLIKARNSVREGRIIASRIYVGGNIVGLRGPLKNDVHLGGFADRVNEIWQENVGPDLMTMSTEQVRREIRKYLQKDIDFLRYAINGHHSVEFVFSPRVQQAIVEEVRRAGIPIQSHTNSAEGVYLAVQAGVDLLQYCDATQGPDPIPAETIALITQRRVPCAIIPSTNTALAWYQDKAKTTPSRFRIYETIDRNDRALLRASAVVLLSTNGGIFSSNTLNSDEWQAWNPPEENRIMLGEGHFHWLLAVEQKGMKPMDALMAATSNIARAYKVDRDLGSLERGKIADLLILDKNPLESAVNYRSINLIVKEGKIVDRDSLSMRRPPTEQSAPLWKGL